MREGKVLCGLSKSWSERLYRWWLRMDNMSALSHVDPDFMKEANKISEGCGLKKALSARWFLMDIGVQPEAIIVIEVLYHPPIAFGN
ncbi:hypothetical protein L6452_34237 [Arctium lappa]|uniref:Uncharacterized protein n=1 Tax=Arctium lappa TaxID=4217 RepID=A0ACB8YIB8_ARCLA|nr:hypothetical protein L6452_34237 [Arctium lappa]